MKTNLHFRLLCLAAVIMAGLNASAADSLLKFVGVEPAPGSLINSPDFKLVFDISEVVEANGPAEYGIGYYGASSRCTKLYQGTGSDKVLLGSALNKTVSGSKDGFTVGNTISVSFPDVTLVAGEAYTLEFMNRFSVYVKGSSTAVTSTTYNSTFDPIEFVFIGGGDESKMLYIESCSLPTDQSIPSLTEAVFNLSAPATLCDGAKAMLIEDGETIASTDMLTLTGTGKRLAVSFGNITLYNDHTYYVAIPVGSLARKDNGEVTNVAYNCKVSGAQYKIFGVKEATPTNGAVFFPSTMSMTFDLPEGATIVSSTAQGSSYKAYLYENSVKPKNLALTYDGTADSDKRGLTWSSVKFSPKPSTDYILCIPAGALKAKSAAGKYDLSCEEIQIPFRSPSIEEFGCPSIELATPINGLISKNGQKLIANAKYEEIGHIQIPMVGLKYEYEGKKYDLTYNSTPWYLYDITDGEEALYKTSEAYSSGFTTSQVEITASNTYRVADIDLSAPLFEGRKYRLVLPAGCLGIGYAPIKNYAVNKEWSIEFEGASAPKFELHRCNLPEESELYEFCGAKWVFNGYWAVNPAYHPSLHSYNSELNYWLGGGLTYTVKYDPSWTTIQAYREGMKSEDFELDKKYDDWKVILPAGFLYYPADPRIANEEIVHKIKRIDKPSSTPEFLNLDIQVNGLTTVSYKVVKSQPATLTFAPDEYWEVENIKLNDEDRTAEVNDGTFTTPALENDSKIEANLHYKGLVINDIPSEIVEIPQSALKVYVDGEFIVVDGVEADDEVALYSVNGLKIGNRTVTETGNKISFSVPNRDIYIVRINNQAVKIRY